MLNVLQLDPAQLTAYYNLALCQVLAESGCRVRYVTSQFLYDKLTYPPSITVDHFYFRGLGRAWLLRYPRLRQLLRAGSYPLDHWRLVQDVKRHRPDIVHIQWSRLPRFDLWLVKQIQALGIPVVHTVHDVEPLFGQTRLAHELGQIYRTANALVVHTRRNLETLLAQYPSLRSSKVEILPHIALSTPAPANSNRTLARQHLNLPLSVPIFGFFGTIKPYKGLDTLFSAFRDIYRINHKAYLLVAGKLSHPNDLPSLDLLEESREHVRLVTDFVPTAEAWAYHLASDVMIFPYRQISQSGALLTAMGYGCPVIVTNVGGLPETVDGNGWVIPSENTLDLVQTMLQAISDPQVLTVMSKRSRELVNQRHDPHKVAHQLIALYKSLGASVSG